MKQFYLLAATLFLACQIHAQDYMTKIAEKSCECLDKIPNNLPAEEFQMKLGLCMIDIAMPYKKQIKKDYGINMDNIAEEGGKLGGIIGVKMAGICPNAVMKMAQSVKDSKAEKAEKADLQSITGVITKIEKDFFVVFSIKDESGKTLKYYWLTSVETKLDLISSYASLIGKNVNITFENQEFFDPKIEDYRTFPVIKDLNQEKN